jgi:hypothetical protein
VQHERPVRVELEVAARRRSMTPFLMIGARI